MRWASSRRTCVLDKWCLPAAGGDLFKALARKQVSWNLRCVPRLGAVCSSYSGASVLLSSDSELSYCVWIVDSDVIIAV